MLVRLRIGCSPGSNKIAFRKRTLCTDFNPEIVFQLTLYCPHLSSYFRNVVFIISFRDFVSILSAPSIRNIVQIGAKTPLPLMRKVVVSPINPVCCTKCPITLLYFRPRSSSAGPSLILSLAGQRYPGASQEFSLTAVHRTSVHKLIKDTTLKLCALQLHAIKWNIVVL